MRNTLPSHLELLDDVATPAPWAEFAESGDWWVERADADGSPHEGDFFVCGSNTGDDGVWRRQADIDLMIALRNLMPALKAVLPVLREIDDWADAHDGGGLLFLSKEQRTLLANFLGGAEL